VSAQSLAFYFCYYLLFFSLVWGLFNQRPSLPFLASIAHQDLKSGPPRL
jgi:hypothetical protein